MPVTSAAAMGSMSSGSMTNDGIIDGAMEIGFGVDSGVVVGVDSGGVGVGVGGIVYGGGAGVVGSGFGVGVHLPISSSHAAIALDDGGGTLSGIDFGGAVGSGSSSSSCGNVVQMTMVNEEERKRKAAMEKSAPKRKKARVADEGNYPLIYSDTPLYSDPPLILIP